MTDEIARLRAQIDALDDEIVARIAARARLAQRIGELKQGAPAYRPEREAGILRRVAALPVAPLAGERMAAVFREIISACRGLEQSLRVAFLGPEGTFSEQALRLHFGGAVATLPGATIDEVFRLAEGGDADFAVVPVENSTEGVVGRTLDLLVSTRLRICGEVELRVRQNLLARGVLAEVVKVYSHPQSLAQCQGWLARHLPHAARVSVASNAEAARLAAGEPGAAAIAGEQAAARYGLELLARAIEDDPENVTRFLALGDIDARPTGRDRTSIVLSADNVPGAVHALLTPIARSGVSMSRIESRPSRFERAGRWEYLFFIDLEGHREDAPLAEALAELGRRAPFCRILGSYPAAARPE